MSRLPLPSTTSGQLFEEFYKGVFRKCATGYSIDESLREVCASGGLVTTLLASRISEGVTSGALVAGLSMDEQGMPSPSTCLVCSAEELQENAGSVYSDFNHVEMIQEILEREEGIFDIVALPCQLSRLRKLTENNSELKKKVGLLVGLWCGHATGVELLETLLRKWKINPGSLSEFRYRTGQWRGNTRITFQDGRALEKSFSKGFGLYQNMYADCALRCFSCGDHFGNAADISFGDCWIRSEKRKEHKKTMAVSFTPSGDKAIETLLRSLSTLAEEIDPVWAVESQKRSVVWQSYSCAARARMKHLFGMSIACPYELSPRWNDYVSGFLTLFYYRMFTSRFRNVLFRLPWWVLFPFMAFQKLMLNK